MKDHGKNVNDRKNDSTGSGLPKSPAFHHSHPPPAPPSERLLPPRGDYHTLLSFQKAEVIYDITFRFAHKFLAKSDRTIDQMIQTNYLKIDVIVVRRASFGQKLRFFCRVFDGSHVTLDCVEYHQVRSFRIESHSEDLLNLDGELKGHSPAAVQMLPGAVRVFA